MRNVRLPDSVGPGLARSPYLERIRVLDLAYGGIRKIGALQALLAAPSLKKLQTLRLYHGDIGDDVAIALANCPYLGGLKLLSLYSNEIDDAALAIARSPYLQTVEFIELSRTGSATRPNGRCGSGSQIESIFEGWAEQVAANSRRLPTQ